MKIQSTKDRNKQSLTPIVILYLVGFLAVTQTVSRVYKFSISNSKRLISWLRSTFDYKRYTGWSNFSNNSIFEIITISVLLGIIVSQILYIMHETEAQKLNAKGYEFYDKISHQPPKMLPAEVYKQLHLSCNEKNTVINQTTESQYITTKIVIENRSEHDFLLMSGAYKFQVRPRIMDYSLKEVVMDGIKIAVAHRKYARVVAAGTDFEEDFTFDVVDIGIVPEKSKYLVFGLVHEGFSWVKSTSKCKFEINL